MTPDVASLMKTGDLTSTGARGIAALLRPEVKSKSDAARVAGISRTTLDRALKTEAGQRYLREATKAQRDSTRTLRQRAHEKVSTNLDVVPDPEYSLKVLKVASDIERDNPALAAEADSEGAADAAYLLLAAVLHGARMGKRYGNRAINALETALVANALSPVLAERLAKCKTVKHLLRLCLSET